MSKLWYAIPIVLLLGLVLIMYAVVASVVTAPPKNVSQYSGYQGESVTFLNSIYFNNYVCKDCVAVEIDGYYEYSLTGYTYKNSKINLSSSQIKIR